MIWLKRLERRVFVYIGHVLALLASGRRPPTFVAHPRHQPLFTEWSVEDYGLLIEEGRRQIDRQEHYLDRLQSRGQFLFTATLGVLAVAASALPRIEAGGGWQLITWWSGMVIAACGLLGTAAVMLTRADLGGIDTTKLSRMESPVGERLAKGYVRVVGIGEDTVATRLTVLRDSLLLLVLGALLLLVAWIGALG